MDRCRELPTAKADAIPRATTANSSRNCAVCNAVSHGPDFTAWATSTYNFRHTFMTGNDGEVDLRTAAKSAL